MLNIQYAKHIRNAHVLPMHYAKYIRTDLPTINAHVLPIHYAKYIRTHLPTINAHVLPIVVALPHPCPLLTVSTVVLTLKMALVTGNRAVHQHPAGVGCALRQGGPGGTVAAIYQGLCQGYISNHYLTYCHLYRLVVTRVSDSVLVISYWNRFLLHNPCTCTGFSLSH